MKKSARVFRAFAVLGVLLIIGGAIIFACSFPYEEGVAAAYSDRMRETLNVDTSIPAEDADGLIVNTVIDTQIVTHAGSELRVQATGDYYHFSPFGKLRQIAENRGGRLRVDFGATGFWGGFWPAQKSTAKLIVSLPENYSGSLNVNMLSGDVELSAGNEFSEVRVDMTSGEITGGVACRGAAAFEMTSGAILLDTLRCEVFSLEMTSGSATVSGLTAERLDADYTSGDISVTATRPVSANVRATAGNFTLRMPRPEGLSMRLRFSCTSGVLRDDYLTGGVYDDDFSTSVGDGSHPYEISAEITSGAVTLAAI